MSPDDNPQVMQGEAVFLGDEITVPTCRRILWVQNVQLCLCLLPSHLSGSLSLPTCALP